MPSHMGVQRVATERNALAETLVDYMLAKFSEVLFEKGYTTAVTEPEQQKDFVREDCSDVFDHYLELPLSRQIDPDERTLQLWGQTTNYKGNPSGKPESNKTYEIRETLAEALTLRKWLRAEKVFFRTIHLTLGPANYTYGWFLPAKENAFDLSLYPSDEMGDFFTELVTIGSESKFDFELYAKFEDAITKKSAVGLFITRTIENLVSYIESGMPECETANKQSDLLQAIWDDTDQLRQAAIRASVNSGSDIKGKAVEMLSGGDIEDPALSATLIRLLSGNPFLPVALNAIGNWEKWSQTAFKTRYLQGTLYNYLYDLWSNPTSDRLLYRRLLLRIYTDRDLEYIQDINVDGIDEHNLYSGIHSTKQVAEICSYLVSRYTENGISTPAQLYSRLTSPVAKRLTKQSLRFESINGTSLKPSFIYIEEYLREKYEFVPFDDTALESPVAYHAAFCPEARVDPYKNMSIIRSRKTGNNLAIIKGKFFRKPEFPRRVKEEAYVGLTTKYTFNGNELVSRYDIPLLMFVDMSRDYTPPEFAIHRIINYGWIPFFDPRVLAQYLDKLDSQ